MEMAPEGSIAAIIGDWWDVSVRLLHPAQRADDAGSHPVRWRDVADLNARAFDPATGSFFSASGVFLYSGDSPSNGWDLEPTEGAPPEGTLRQLMGVLRLQTETPSQTVFGVWDGYAEVRAIDVEHPSLSIRGRRYLWRTGPIDCAMDSAGLGPRPNIWWPADRAWLVASDIDLPYTCIGGTEVVWAALAADSNLEVARVDPRSVIGEPRA